MKTLSLDELLSVLRVHEVHLQSHDHIKRKESIALKIEKKISSSKALKAEESEGSSSHSLSSSSEDKLSLLWKKLKHMMKMKGKFNHSSRQKDKRTHDKKLKEKNDETRIVCYRLKKPGHIKVDCTLERRRWSSKKIKKSLLALWDESSSNSSSEEEQTNIWLMTDINHDERVEVETITRSSSSCNESSDDDDMSYDVLLKNCHMLTMECKSFKTKNKVLNKKNLAFYN